MADFVELGAEGVNHVVENYWDDINHGASRIRHGGKAKDDKYGNGERTIEEKKDIYRERSEYPTSERGGGASRVSGKSGGARRYRNQLPSPERESAAREDSLERQSLTSDRITSAYENERDDPIRPVDPKLDRKLRRDSGRMSYAGGYNDRAHSAQPPRSRYNDDNGSDYDERTGKRYSGGGARGYDDHDDRGYDREVITEERYRGPARGAPPYESRRNDSYGGRDPYGPGAVATYRRSQGDLTETTKRSRSGGRRDRERDRSYDSRSRSRSGSGSYDSRSRSRPRKNRNEEEGWKGKLEDTFDTSTRGLGAGLVGAVVGGLAGRQFGNKHKERDVLLGAVIGGLASNIAENKYAEWKEEKEGKLREKESRWEARQGR
ncbi:hypothetical protein LTR62_005683 [Meristemomyces frigidus]|uniref:Glycine zipper 2TM domain-containing protein n=1 Tax=Meristemomyces frigidus TaxID=1508187 RepID=A0AAN7TKL1_9PEZI|nr:hypothetical protein LTR62_005683 [Meristemomyces frigidus]